MKERVKKSSLTAWNLMDYVEEQLELNNFSPDDLDRIINGIWAEKTTCTVRQHLMFDDVRGYRIIHYDAADAFYELFKVMKESNLGLQDLECHPYYFEFPNNPIIYFTVHTCEHDYKYYPVMLSSQCDSEKDEYVHIKDRIAHLNAVYCDSTHKPEENSKTQDRVDR